MSIQLVILIVYIIGLLALSAWATRIQRRATDSNMLSYLLAGRVLMRAGAVTRAKPDFSFSVYGHHAMFFGSPPRR